ncbi:GWxTD domain-containing protein [bacterium]|nr:GWxTD domain-containing protein [bacterium]
MNATRSLIRGLLAAVLLVALAASVPAQEMESADSMATETGETRLMDTIQATTEDGETLEFVRSQIKFFTVDHAALRYDKSRLQLEAYALIDRGYLGVQPVEGGVQARYEITFQIRDGNDSLLIGDSWIRNDWSADSTARGSGQKIPELIRYVVEPGTYRIATRVVDLVSKVFFIEEYPVTLDSIPTDEVAISSIILASRIEKTEDDVGEFDHNGLLVLPNAERMFGQTNPQVYYYAEIYNLSSEPGSRYTVRREVLNDRREVVKPLEPKDREVMAADLAEVDGFNVGTLRTGSYILQLIVTDQTTGQTTSNERSFWVYRPEEAHRLVPLVDPGFDIAALSKEEVNEELKRIRYLMTDRVQDRVDAMRDDDARRTFLARFWAANDPDTSTAYNEFREEYQRRLRIVNDRYGSLQRDGWNTDRGRVYLLNGEPSYIEDHPFDSDIGKAYQIWEYHQLEGGVVFVFVDRNNYGDYVQVHSTKRGEINNPSWYQLELR